jgi:threonyl-tRNA synthetase
MIKVTLPDGSQREYAKGSTSLDVAKSISEGLARNVLSAEVDGEVWDASRPLERDVTLRLLTWDSLEGKATFWHSSAHLMAEALEFLYPGVKLGIGPAVEHGFYYDVDFNGWRSRKTLLSVRRFLSKMLSLILPRKMIPTN